MLYDVCVMSSIPAMGKRGLGRSRERGRNRVPFLGPPTSMRAFMLV